MIHPLHQKLAEQLVNYSLDLKRNEKVLIDAFDAPDRIVIALIRAVRRRKALPFVQFNHSRVTRELFREANVDQLDIQSTLELQRIRKMDAYIAIRGADNIFETSDVSARKMAMAMQRLKPVLDHRVDNTRWVVLRWPTPSMAQQAGMSTEAFENFYFAACTFNYVNMVPGMRSLKRLMEKTDRVDIQGPGTDLHFSIKGIPAMMSSGRHNVPDGEVFTAPVKASVEGEITFNAPTVYQGVRFQDVWLKFRKGKIIDAKANNVERLNEILDSDAGARYIGEFALGINPLINEPICDILFDEKITGSFHFTPGQAYEKADNGNRSQVHWDMVSIQRRDYGGGTIAFDGEVIRKNGLFLPEKLQRLNPKNLLES